MLIQMDKKNKPSLTASVVLLCVLGGMFALAKIPRAILVQSADPAKQAATKPKLAAAITAKLDTAAYDAKLLQIANLITVTSTRVIKGTKSTPTSTIITTSTTPVGWPVKTVYPNAGALLPFNRIVAYYGNLYSTQMGVLGKYPKDQVLQMLSDTVKDWQDADPTTPVIPALDYIAISAQGTPGFDGNYRSRMPDDQIDQVIQMASQVNGIVFLDLQIGLSNVQTELPLLEPYLKLPQVHLALDPEFAMHNGQKPGTVVGTLDASDINFAANYLAKIVQENNLPPKILVIHRFTQPMVTNAENITPLPEVQIVMDMDGFGGPAQKLGTYKNFIQSEPVQFTGFKLFYVNDVAAGHMLTPSEVLKVSPQPSYIQYQ
jgi:hypothetical protein